MCITLLLYVFELILSSSKVQEFQRSDHMMAMCEMSNLISHLTEILGFFMFLALHMDSIMFRMLISVKGDKKRPVLWP